MKRWEKTIFTFIFKTYKLIKYILYKIFIFPFQYATWNILKFWYRHFHGWRRHYKVIYRDKIFVYFGVILILLCMLKHTQYILYDPLAYDDIMYWPKRIKSLRKLALVHWISYMLIYTGLYILSWIFWQVHYHFKEYGQTVYYEYWFWYSMWYHGVWWDAIVKYMNNGYGMTGLIYFTIVNHFFWFSFWGCEFLEELEYDWDDYFDSYEGAYIEDEDSYINVNATLMRKLADREQALLDEITWDVFGTTEKIGDDPDKVQARWNIWSLLMYPPLALDDDDRLEMEFVSYVADEPWDVWDYYVSLSNERDPFDCEYWWQFWTTFEENHWEEMMRTYDPFVNFYLRWLKPFYTLPRKRIRAVGEYSRYNWRYKVWIMRFTDIPNYDGWYESTGREVRMVIKHTYFILRALFLYWYRGLRYSVRDWKDIWFRKKYRKQVRKLRKWGSKNYSFFGKKNYKPKK